MKFYLVYPRFFPSILFRHFRLVSFTACPVKELFFLYRAFLLVSPFNIYFSSCYLYVQSHCLLFSPNFRPIPLHLLPNPLPLFYFCAILLLGFSVIGGLWNHIWRSNSHLEMDTSANWVVMVPTPLPAWSRCQLSYKFKPFRTKTFIYISSVGHHF